MMVLTFLPEIRPQAKIKNAAVELDAVRSTPKEANNKLRFEVYRRTVSPMVAW
jgi:hypothetical protein